MSNPFDPNKPRSRKDTSWVTRQQTAIKPQARPQSNKILIQPMVGAARNDVYTLGRATSNSVPAPANVLASVQVTQPGLVSERTRLRMVERVREQGVQHPEVLQAMTVIPRHAFVDEGLASRAYEDTALPIGHGQTISQPYIVGRMIALLLASPTAKRSKVLEIGTGCGYQAAVLGQVYREVVSVERIRALHELARKNLRPLRLPNVRLVLGDGMLGVPQVAPYDAIILAAAGLDVPAALLTQLAVGGRLVAPVGESQQNLRVIDRIDEQSWQQTELDAVRFVPLLSGTV